MDDKLRAHYINLIEDMIAKFETALKDSPDELWFEDSLDHIHFRKGRTLCINWDTHYKEICIGYKHGPGDSDDDWTEHKIEYKKPLFGEYLLIKRLKKLSDELNFYQENKIAVKRFKMISEGVIDVDKILLEDEEK